MLIQLHYTARVYVEVDTDTGVVERVVIDDESATLDPDNSTDARNVTPSKLGDYPAPPPELVSAAVAIAADDDTEWPAWQFRY